ncbi:hypothetical protein Tco_1060368 [Tanacetum coccineum]
MASSLSARSSRRVVSNLLASSVTVTSGGAWCSKWDFFGNVMAKLDKHLLKRLPHTICRTVRGETLEGISLSILGNEKRTETDEALNVFLDFDAKNAKGIGVRAQLDFNYNVLFVRAHVQPTSDARINLGNDIMYKTIHTQNKDGGILLTLHKNPDRQQLIKPS